MFLSSAMLFTSYGTDESTKDSATDDSMEQNDEMN